MKLTVEEKGMAWFTRDTMKSNSLEYTDLAKASLALDASPDFSGTL